MADSNAHITLTADVSQYVRAMRHARRATRRLRFVHDIPVFATGLALGINATLAAIYTR